MPKWFWDPFLTSPGVDFGSIFEPVGLNFGLLGASWDHLGPTFWVFLLHVFFNRFLLISRVPESPSAAWVTYLWGHHKTTLRQLNCSQTLGKTTFRQNGVFRGRWERGIRGEVPSPLRPRVGLGWWAWGYAEGQGMT